MKQYMKALAGFGAALAIIAVFSWQVGWGDIVFALTHAQLRYLVPGLVLIFASLAMIGVSWWIAIREVAGLDFLNGMRVFFVTYFANSVTPLGQFGGEPFIAYILSKDAKISMEESLGAVVVADVLNAVPFFTVSFLGILTFLVFFPIDPFIATILKVILALSVIAGMLVLLFYHNRSLMVRLAGWVGRMINRTAEAVGLDSHRWFASIDKESVEDRTDTFYDIVHRITNRPRTVGRVLIVIHISYVLSPIGMWLILYSLGVDVPLSALLFIMSAAMLAGFLPLPGGTGGIELAMVTMLTTITAVPASIATAAVLIYRTASYWLGLSIGGFFATRMSIDVVDETYSN